MESSQVEGSERTAKSKVLETGAALTQVPPSVHTQALSLSAPHLTTYIHTHQDFTPVKSICAHLNAFHVYADDPKRFVEANHYCSHLTEGESYMPRCA